MITVPTAPQEKLVAFAGDTFVGYDFDGTVARTFDPSPHNISVGSAYDSAIDQVFGTRVLAKFHANGGLCNRAPIEIVKQLAPDAKRSEQMALLEQLDAVKLSVLLDEITPQWPKPTEGYLDFAIRLQEAREKGASVTDGIVSSGHEPFIAKTYDVWGVQQPTILLAQEAITGMAASEKRDTPTKPSAIIMRYAHTAWRNQFNLPPMLHLPAEDVARMAYVGDDRIKDGVMAVTAGVKFHLLNPENSHATWARLANAVGAIVVGGANVK